MQGFQVVFEIETEEKLRVLHSQDWEFRGRNCMELVRKAAPSFPANWIGSTVGISFGDHPPSSDWAEAFDFSFCTTKLLGVPSPCLPLPCPYVLRWPEVGIPDTEAMLETMLAAESPVSDERIFWIGAETHPSRGILWSLAQDHPHLFDVELMVWDRHALGGQKSRTRQVPLPAHRDFKYLIDCPGYGYSARLKWLLATGRPVFVVDRANVEHWHEELSPWIHFIPVLPDLSDLLQHHDRLEKDPGLYEEIGRNAREFAAAQLRLPDQLKRTALALEHSSIRAHSSQKFSGTGTKDPVGVVIASRGEQLSWTSSLPQWAQVYVIDKGAPIAGERSERAYWERRIDLGGAEESFLSFLERGGHHGHEWVVFAQSDPFGRSPGFLKLFDQLESWNDLQPLSCQGPTGLNLPPSEYVECEHEHWVQGNPVRKEIFSLNTLAPVYFRDPVIERAGDDYRKKYHIGNGANIAEHFLRMIGLDGLAAEAAGSSLGAFCWGSMMAVRSERIDRFLPAESLTTARRLCQGDGCHSHLMGRLWLHLFGEAFLLPKHPGTTAASSRILCRKQ